MPPEFRVLPRSASLLVIIALLLAACQGSAAPTPPDRIIPQPGPGSTSSPTVRPTRVLATRLPTEVPTVLPLPQLDRPIVWVLRGEPPPDLPQVNEQLNRILAERDFNARIELRVVEQSAFYRQMVDMLSEKQAWDLVSLDFNSYPGWVEQDALLPLVDYHNPVTNQNENLLGQHAPWLSSVQSSLGGGYAVANPSIWSRPRGVSIRADVIRALNLQSDLDRAQSFADLTPLLVKIQAAVADGTIKTSAVTGGDSVRFAVAQADLLQAENAGYDRLWGPFVVRYDDLQGRIINWYQSSEFKALADLRRAWQLAGYFPQQPLAPAQVVEGYRSGRYVVEVGRPVWAGSALEQSRRYGYEWIDRPLAPAFWQTRAVFSSLTGVNARIAQDPERVQRVMQFLALVHSNREIYNLLAYGIQGQHWQWVDSEHLLISLTPDSGYQPDFIDQLGDRSLSYAAGTTNRMLWLAVREQNAKAPASIALDFFFDSRPVAAEAAAVDGLSPELLDPLVNGQAKDVDKAISALQKALDAAGLDTVQVELEQQWAKWLNARNE